MLTLLMSWLAIGASLAWLVSRRTPGSAGLPLAYFLGTSLIHVPGAALYLDAEGSDPSRIGFEQTTIGMMAFLIGVVIARSIVVRQQVESTRNERTRSATGLDRLSLLYLSIGSVAYFVLLPLSGAVHSLTSIIAPLGSLIIVGACLRLHVAIESRNRRKLWAMIVLLPLLPLATLLQGGFLGFGTYWVIAIGTFLFAQLRRRIAVLLLAPIAFFVGLSIFVNYMAARDEIRDLVWYQQSSIGDRLDRIANVFIDFDWLDFSNHRHRATIDRRLNQNMLVGLTVSRLESGTVQYAAGATIWKMAAALVPRAIWPDKPSVGGGGTVVSDFTGLQFNESTSVGAGQVLEFYANFGSLGLIIGFVVFGGILGFMDVKIIECLRNNDQRGMLMWFVVSLSLVQPGGNLVEIAAAAAGASIAGLGLGYCLQRRWVDVRQRASPQVPRSPR